MSIRLATRADAATVTDLVNRACEVEWPPFGKGRQRTGVEEIGVGMAIRR